MSQSTPQPANPPRNVPKKREPMSPILANIRSNAVLDDDAAKLLSNIQHILAAKAPEALPLLVQLLTKLSSLSLDAVHTEKRERFIVIHGIPEADAGLSASLRQQSTERCVSKILDVLDIEIRPIGVFRMGKVGQKPRMRSNGSLLPKFTFQTLSKN
ncbi:unnamed protein product [Haemonchus placei]|uniref:DZF domain-containing protein n=1 Tax=Haemonchus placei TaxID=6290 RepID=A0A0N4W3J8_HAEPC|nr:unnamed protein product [Haemonchus placei]